jgi:hypothetical protein
MGISRKDAKEPQRTRREQLAQGGHESWMAGDTGKPAFPPSKDLGTAN